MPDAVELLKAIKKAAVDAVKATKPVEIGFGKVTSTDPLKILVEQKMTLGKAQLILSRSVADRGLAVGDEVILLRQQGGQKYVVLDGVGS